MERDLKQMKDRLALARAGAADPSRALELGAEEIRTLWEALHEYADILARQRDRDTVLFERAPFACVVTDGHGDVREANAAALELLGVPAAYLRGKPLAIFVTADGRDAFRRATLHAADPRRPPPDGWPAQLQSPNEGTSSVRVDVRTIPAARADEPAQIVWFLRAA